MPANIGDEGGRLNRDCTVEQGYSSLGEMQVHKTNALPCHEFVCVTCVRMIEKHAQLDERQVNLCAEMNKINFSQNKENTTHPWARTACAPRCSSGRCCTRQP